MSNNFTPAFHGPDEWLFLLHQLPASASNGRVKTWRRLQGLGAVWLRNAAYVLPNSPQAREDFMWLRGEIASLGGAATVIVADAIDQVDRLAIVEAFSSAREADYAALRGRLRQIQRRADGARSPGSRGRIERQVKALVARLREIEAVDFFSAPGGDEARRALQALEDRVGGTPRPKRGSSDQLTPDAYRQRVWVTRRRPGVDRMSSAWLIRQFIDPEARFVFADADQPAPADQVAFDRFDGEFTHEGDKCTFEVLAGRFGLESPAIRRIAEIVHDLDLKDDRHRRPETMTVGTLIDGIRKAHADDGEALKAGMEMFEGLYRAFETQDYTKATRPASKRRGRRSAPARRRR